MSRTFVITAFALTSLLGCSFETLDEHPCPPGGTDLTYDGFAQPFFATWCDGCHAAEVGNRNGAPENYVFDTREAVVEHAERIYARAAGPNTSMPPGPDDPPEDDRQRLADWLACGAPR